VADDSERDSERTTIVTSDGDGRGSAAIVLVVVVLIVILLAALFFGGAFNRGEERELNVDINTPDVNVIVPQTQVPVVTVPEVQVPSNVNVNMATPPTELPEENLSNTGTAVTNSG